MFLKKDSKNINQLLKIEELYISLTDRYSNLFIDTKEYKKTKEADRQYLIKAKLPTIKSFNKIEASKIGLSTTECFNNGYVGIKFYGLTKKNNFHLRSSLAKLNWISIIWGNPDLTSIQVFIDTNLSDYNLFDKDDEIYETSKEKAYLKIIDSIAIYMQEPAIKEYAILNEEYNMFYDHKAYVNSKAKVFSMEFEEFLLSRCEPNVDPDW